jgi:hypothetical protein
VGAHLFVQVLFDLLASPHVAHQTTEDGHVDPTLSP